MTAKVLQTADETHRQLDEQNPWPGLTSFTEEGREFFNGRRAETTELRRLTIRETLTILFGKSGLGKTSLLQAGLFPLLRTEDFLPVYVRLEHDPEAPPRSHQLLQELLGECQRQKVDAPPCRPEDGLWEYLHRAEHAFWSARNRLLTPVFVIDQFEEIFTIGARTAPGGQTADEFVEALGDLIAHRAPPRLARRWDEEPTAVSAFSFTDERFKVVLALREDFLASLESLQRQLRVPLNNRMRLERMNGEQALRAVLDTGRHVVDRDTAEAIVRRLGGGAPDDGGEAPPLVALEAEPALLSLFCRDLNERRKRIPGRTKIEVDLLYGSHDEILEDFYARSLADLDPRVRAFVEDALLTESGRFRNSVALEDAIRIPGVTLESIESLIQRRFLRVEEGLGVPRVELAHDVLTQIVRESRDRRRAEEDVARANMEAQRQREVAFASTRQLRRARAAAGTLGVLTIAAVGLGLLAWRKSAAAEEQRQKAERSVLLSEYREAVRQAEAGNHREALAWIGRVLARERGHAPNRALAFSLLLHQPILRITHEGHGHASEFSPDGQLIATASGNVGQLWDAASGRALSEPLRHTGEVWSIAFSPDGRRVVTASYDSTVQVWDAVTGAREGAAFRHGAPVRQARFSPDGALVVTSPLDGRALLWNVATGQLVGGGFRHSAAVRSAAFSPDGALLITGSDDSTAQVWDVRTGRRAAPPLRHGDAVWSVRFSNDGRRVVTASADNSAQVWDAQSGARRAPPLRHADELRSAAFDADGERVITGSEDNMAQVWDAGTGVRIGAPLQHAGLVTSVAFSPDGRRMLTTSWQNATFVWEPERGRLQTLSHRDNVYSAAFSPAGDRLITAADSAARVWDGSTGAPIGAALRHQGEVFSALFSPDGTRIVTASEDSTAQVWDVASGRRIGAPMRHRALVSFATFSADSRRVITASDDGTAATWHASTGTRVGPEFRHDAGVWSAVFSPDGARVLTASADHTAQQWDARTGARLGAPLRHSDEVNFAMFSPDGTRIVTASEDNTAQVWNAATGARIGSALRHTGGVNSAVFSPDGQRLITTADDDAAQIWDAVRGARIGPPMVHDGAVWNANFGPDGQRVITGAHDRTAVVWDARTGTPDDAIRLASFIERVLTARLDENGSLVAAPPSQTTGSERAGSGGARPGSLEEFVARYFPPMARR